MLLKLVFCVYFMLYFTNGLSTHSRYSNQENVKNLINKEQENNAQDVMEPKNEYSNKSVGNSNGQRLSDKRPRNDINKLDQNLPNIKEPYDKQPRPSVDSKEQHSKKLNKNLGQVESSSQRLPNSQNVPSNGQKAHGNEEITNRQSNQNQGYAQKISGTKEPTNKNYDNQIQGSGQKAPGENEPTYQQSNKNQIQVSNHNRPGANSLSHNNYDENQGSQRSVQKAPDVNEPINKQLSKNQIQGSGQKTSGANKPSNKQSNKNQIQVSGQKTSGANGPTYEQPNKNQIQVSGQNTSGANGPTNKQSNENQSKKKGGQKLTDFNQDIKQSNQNVGKPDGKKIEERPGGQKLPDTKKPSKNQGKPDGQKLPNVKWPSKHQDMGPLNDSCPSNKSLHSRNDIIVMINYVYKQLSVDENIREAYQSHAISLRDKHFKELNKFNTWFHNQPEHLEHVLQSLSSIRKQLIEPNVKKIAKLLNDNSDMDKVIKLKKERLRLSTKKLNRYEMLCNFNCEEGEERSMVKRNVQDEYFCSSIEDLYNKINTRLSEFVQRFNNESNNRFAKDNEIYHKKIENIKNMLKDKGLQMFGRTMYDILHLQDEYHHYVEHLNISSLEKEINLAKNLSIEVEAKLLELNEQIEIYGQYCRSCAGGSSRRNIREATPKMDSKQVQNSENLVDLLIDIKFNETAVRVHNDWDTIFKDLNQLITKTEKENPRIGKFKSIQIKVIKMIAKEKKVLNKLKSTTSNIGIQKAVDWIKILRKLLRIIIEIIKHMFKLNSGH